MADQVWPAMIIPAAPASQVTWPSQMPAPKPSTTTYVPNAESAAATRQANGINPPDGTPNSGGPSVTD